MAVVTCQGSRTFLLGGRDCGQWQVHWLQSSEGIWSLHPETKYRWCGGKEHGQWEVSPYFCSVLHIGGVMDRVFVSLQTSYIEFLTPSGMVWGGGPFGEVMVEPSRVGFMPLSWDMREMAFSFATSLPILPVTTQREDRRLSQTPDVFTPWSWTYQPPELGQ